MTVKTIAHKLEDAMRVCVCLCLFLCLCRMYTNQHERTRIVAAPNAHELVQYAAIRYTEGRRALLQGRGLVAGQRPCCT
jgi:hypothetical protein